MMHMNLSKVTHYYVNSEQNNRFFTRIRYPYYFSLMGYIPYAKAFHFVETNRCCTSIIGIIQFLSVIFHSIRWSENGSQGICNKFLLRIVCFKNENLHSCQWRLPCVACNNSICSQRHVWHWPFWHLRNTVRSIFENRIRDQTTHKNDITPLECC